jgi:hypothetical protein
VFAPAGTPTAIVDRFNRKIKDELGQWKQIASEHKSVAE